MSTLKLVALTFAFAIALLGVLYAPAYLVLGGPMVPWFFMVIPALLFGLTAAAALDKPLERA